MICRFAKSGVWAKSQRAGWPGRKVKTCGDLQNIPLPDLVREFGKFGSELYSLCRGVDERSVKSTRVRKSLSNERTYREDLADFQACHAAMHPLIEELKEDLAAKSSERVVHKVFVKLKFNDFQQTTVERVSSWPPDPLLFPSLLEEGWKRGSGKPVRLLGTGVRFAPLADDERQGGADGYVFGRRCLNQAICHLPSRAWWMKVDRDTVPYLTIQ